MGFINSPYKKKQGVWKEQLQKICSTKNNTHLIWGEVSNRDYKEEP